MNTDDFLFRESFYKAVRWIENLVSGWRPMI